ncbi:MAG: VOC family protein [Bryobacterales bacterium]|nr:VOC family protein [Bryobacterales bacterium]
MSFLGKKARTCWWFKENGHEAAAYYVSILPDSYLEGEVPSPTEPPLVVEFTLAGAPMMILNGGPHYPQTPAASISILTEDQAETDRLWEALTANGGQESQCGWLMDRWGVSWQIVPRKMPELFGSPDRAAAGRAQKAMMLMKKIDIAALEKAFAGA